MSGKGIAMKVCVIGGGASGLCAAITAAQAGGRVTVIEHGSRVGKKLLSTGNGKCNLSNADQKLSHYHGDPDFISGIFDKVSYEDVISFLTRLGIFTKNRNGYLYPYSEQASSVLDVFRFALRRYGVETVLSEEILDISAVSQGSGASRFIIRTGQQERYFDRVIIAAGSKAAPVTGSDGSGYKLAKAFGHRIIKPLPALVSLKSDDSYCKELKGIRFKADAALYTDDQERGRESGELQFVDYGLSGIPIFQLSYIASEALNLKRKPKVSIKVDLFPIMSISELTGYLIMRKEADPYKSASEFMIGFLPKNIAILINRLCGTGNNEQVSRLTPQALEAAAYRIKNLEFNITGTGGFEKAQTCVGGVDTSELTSELESKLVPGLYFAGEIIDVNGDCGGYNLTWAFATGILAGFCAAGHHYEKELKG